MKKIIIPDGEESCTYEMCFNDCETRLTFYLVPDEPQILINKYELEQVARITSEHKIMDCFGKPRYFVIYNNDPIRHNPAPLYTLQQFLNGAEAMELIFGKDNHTAHILECRTRLLGLLRCESHPYHNTYKQLMGR